MTELTLKTEQQGTYFSSAEDDCTASDSYSVANSLDISVISTDSPTGDEQVEDDFSIATNEDFPGSEDLLEDLCCCGHIETRLLLFQSSLDLFHDVGGASKPKSEQVDEASRPIKTVTKAETIDKTTKPALMSCLKVLEQETCSSDTETATETDFTVSDLSLTSGRGKTVDCFRRTGTAFECYPEDDVLEVADDVVRGVDFAEITVRTFACCLGDNPSTSKSASTSSLHIVQHGIILNPSCELNTFFLLGFFLSFRFRPTHCHFSEAYQHDDSRYQHI
jgi:hypothetical protein